ncbi:MAG: MBL fold metallo-hydrolase [Phycisphaerae bacterium]|jgi:7,8-dihydropterin-6-yl-methyl-4-(beta-D-ribofuranosyl)aminobenzene 5'-phosphate synthase
MGSAVRITVLVENSVHRRELLAEHGVAFWIEIRGCRVLFDTGQGMVLSGNAHKSGVDLRLTDAVVLSHGHYDHTGGVEFVLRVARHARIYAHPAALLPKYARTDDAASRDIGMPKSAREAIDRRREESIETPRPTEVCKGLVVTGEIPRQTEYEDTGGPFFTDPELRVPDPLLDDQALFFDSLLGTVVILGCAHAGIVNTLQHIHQLTNGRPIHAVMGGMHLATASRQRIDRTIGGLRQFNVERLGPAHCTGLKATAELWNAFPGRCFPCGTGTTIEFKVA